MKITTGEWEPFISEKFTHGGVILHIVREAFERKNLDVKITFFSWARAVKLVDNGEWDAMAVTGSRHSKQGIHHIYSDPVYVGRDVIFSLQSRPLKWQKFEDIRNQRFGAVLSYDYSDAYRQSVKDGRIEEVVSPKPHLLFRMLVGNRIDAFIMDRMAGNYVYNTRYRETLGDSIVHSSRPLLTLEYSVRFSGDGERSKRLHKMFNESLRDMHADGTIQRFYNNFQDGYYLNHRLTGSGEGQVSNIVKR